MLNVRFIASINMVTGRSKIPDHVCGELDKQIQWHVYYITRIKLMSILILEQVSLIQVLRVAKKT